MKKLELALLLGFAASICVSAVAKTADTQERLEQQVLRLHILANSDSIDDQALKLKVRDRVLTYAETLLDNPDMSLEETEATVAQHLPQLEELAETVVEEEGFSYPVSAQLVEMEFEDRTYGELTMPAGTYEALRITIGKAEGQNWWCVMYPALCVPNATEVTDDAETEQTAFDSEEQALLEHPERYRIRLKCVEWLKQWL